MIPFNVPPFAGREVEYMKQAAANKKISGDGPFTKKCSTWLEQKTGSKKVLLTTSCSSALEMAALLAGIEPGDEVILPSYTFVSTANAFVLRGAKLVFVDIRPDTMNLNEQLIEDAVTDRTKAIVPVHYAGVGCEMDSIMETARRHGLVVIEDAAQGVMASYRGRALGSIGDLACFSFHETKNYSMGEGGAILINNENFIENAEIIREKGTDRSRFLRGQVDKYSWISIGSSYLPSDLNAAYLWAELEEADTINDFRLAAWRRYYDGFRDLQEEGCVGLPVIPDECRHNAHMFYLKVRDLEERGQLIRHLKDRGIAAVFHYVPLHSAAAGKKYGVFHGEDRYTTRESSRLLRLPMYYGLKDEEIDQVIAAVREFFAPRRGRR
ncbi:MAG: dTDP-4-amino-4,6-dideoxygalactose transaminase [Anaerovoracaceae bacterium]